MRRWFLPFALALPALVLAIAIVRQEIALANAETWHIPVAGYDPRDLVRGRYIRFTYDWQVRGDAAPCETDAFCQLCLDGPPPDASRTRIQPMGASCTFPVRTNDTQLAFVSPRRSLPFAFVGGRMFVDERSAPALENALREGPMLLVARRTADGRLLPVRLEPNPNPPTPTEPRETAP
ncbi:MAG: GDYXXLXY domain-containing protein [Pacificimonas sp.]|jgi:hypothetical protein|nr:GDYXXLXY domain-containing protein [Pacificimonas sp.]